MANRLVSIGTKIASSSTRLVFKTAEKSQALALSARPHLIKFWSYARVEMDPPRPSQWPEIKKGFQHLAQSARTGAFLAMPMKQVIPNLLVATEVACWFIVGEMIGRRSIIGYRV